MGEERGADRDAAEAGEYGAFQHAWIGRLWTVIFFLPLVRYLVVCGVCA